MADNETIADIIAWLRRPREGENAYLTLWRDEIADRLEAAHRRERGDCAKLREALETALKTIRGVINSTISPRSNTVFDCRGKLSAALSAPPRNCDVGTAEEQEARYNKFCGSHKSRHGNCFGCPALRMQRKCEIVWAQMPYAEKEGGAK